MKYYIDIDSDENITALYSCPQYENQPLIDIIDDDKVYKYINGQLVENTTLTLLKYKALKIEELKQLHIAFMNKPFKVTIERDDLTSVSFWLNCTDETANNLTKALEAARLEGGIYFYNGGTDADLSVAEMEKVVRGFNAICLPSFRIKGENKLAINASISIEEIDIVMANVQF